MRTVVRLSVTPVKSMQLVHPARIRLERFGVLENRRFYVADQEGRLLSGPPHDRLIPLRPAYDPAGETLAIGFPDGRTVEGPASDVVGPRVETNFWGRPVTAHEVDGPFSEALSEHVGRRVRLLRTDEPGTGIDSSAVSLFSSASAEELDRQAARADEPLDRRRWRMLVEVGGCRPHEEDEWVGGRVRLGDAVIDVTRTDPRCRITSLDPDTGVKDVDTLRILASYRKDLDGDLPFGVYAAVLEPGPVAVGDVVEPI